MAKIDVQRGSTPVAVASGATIKSMSPRSATSWTFTSALYMGFAFSLPLIIMLALFMLIYYLVTIGAL